MVSSRACGGLKWLAVAVCAFLLVSNTYAALGDRPLTQLAGSDLHMEFQPIEVAANTFSGVAVDPRGVMYVTWNNGIMRVPTSTVNTTTARKVGDWTVSPAPTSEDYDPCVSATAPIPVSPFYTCRQPSTRYIGDTNILYYPNVAGAYDNIRLPWLHHGRLFAIGNSPSGPRIIQYDAATFSRWNVSYNAIDHGNLQGSFKILQDDTYVYIFSNHESGNVLVTRVPLANPDALGSWLHLAIGDSSINDVHWNPAKNAFFMIGRAGAVTNGVWTVPNSGYTPTDTITPIAVTAVATDASCAGTGQTIAYDADPKRGDRVYIGCTGTLTVPGFIQALNPTTFAVVNSTALMAQDDLWTTWIHDPVTGIIYIPTQGRSGSDGLVNLMQYSTVGDSREGRIELSIGLNGKAIAFSPLVAPEGSRYAESPMFFVVGTNPVSQLPSFARWSGAQGCLDNCGAFSTPVRGSCTRRECTCGNYEDPESGETLDWLAPWCSTLTCAFNCNQRGTCANSTCVCDRIWRTTDPKAPCSERRCPNDCLAELKHGTCNEPPSANYTCSCNPGWSGDDCSIKVKYPCNLLTNNCTACVDNPACIWCSSSRTCMYGDVNGPSDRNLKNTECRSWFWGSCPSVGIVIVNYIITGILGVCLLISYISGTLVDTSEEIPERRTEWYLFQRAGKIWSMIYQLQLVAIAGLINFAYPTSFFGFLRYWNWILLDWGFPWHHSKTSQDTWHDSTATTGRSTKSWLQHTTYWKSEVKHIFFTFLLWWGVALGVFIVFYLITLVISLIRRGRTAFLASTRPTFIFLRILEFGHLGVCVMGPLSIIKNDGAPASPIVGAILWAIFGLGVPIGLFIWLGLLKDKKELFKPTFAASFYPYYGAYDFRFRMFIVAPWIKRILIGLFIGFVANSNPLGQLIPVAIIHLAYLILVIFQRNMFSDYLQRYLEIILAALNFASFMFLFGFYGTPSSGVVNAMGIIFLILQFLGVVTAAAFFIISWLQLNQVYSIAQCIKFCTCRAEK